MIEEIWGEILSEDETRVRSAYGQLTTTEKDYVIKHLNRMANEEGWHPSQTRSANYALKVLDRNTKISN